MAAKKLPDQAYLRECYTYDPQSGQVRWLHRPIEHFTSRRGWCIFNGKFAGKPAGCISEGRVILHIYESNVRAHRVIWKLVTGRDPIEVDHIDGDATNNRWSNLREATHSQNGMNKAGRNNHKYLKGTSPHPRGGWQSFIGFQGKQFYLGYHKTEEAAHAAYCEAATRLHGEFANFGHNSVTRPVRKRD